MVLPRSCHISLYGRVEAVGSAAMSSPAPHGGSGYMDSLQTLVSSAQMRTAQSRGLPSARPSRAWLPTNPLTADNGRGVPQGRWLLAIALVIGTIVLGWLAMWAAVLSSIPFFRCVPAT